MREGLHPDQIFTLKQVGEKPEEKLNVYAEFMDLVKVYDRENWEAI